VPKIPPERKWEFHTKIEQAVELIDWSAKLLSHKDKSMWLAAGQTRENR